MLDSETKRRIDSARDILVGKVPDPKSQVEQITIALVYKFMDDMDKQSVAMEGKASFFKGEFKKYSWTNIFDPRLGGAEMLNLYGEAITSMSQNANLPELFRNIFKNAFLPYRDPETLKLFLKTINEFTYDHSEKLGDAFEYLLSVLGSQGDAGQFRTPRHIIDFMVQVIDPKKNETVLDPACGTAGFLISAYKYMVQSAKESGKPLNAQDKKRIYENFKGYDISPDMVRLSLVNLYLHGFVTPQIYEYDSLTSEDRWNEYADVILANPPFMSPKGGIQPHKRFSVQSNRSEVLFVDYMAEHLTPNGRAAIIVPEGIIFQSAGAYKQLRKYLIEHNFLWAVVSLPAGAFNPYSGVKTSILFLDKSLAKKTDKVLFVKVENDGFGLGAQRNPIDKNDLPQTLKVLNSFRTSILDGKTASFAPETDSALLVSISTLAENDYNLGADRYREVIRTGKQNCPIVSMADVCEKILDGSHTIPKGVEFSEYLMLSSKNIVDGKITFDDPRYLSEKDFFSENRRTNLTAGDVLLTIVGALGRTALVPSDLKNVVLQRSVAVLKVNKRVILPEYLKVALDGEELQKIIKSRAQGVAQKGLYLGDIAKLPVPLPTMEVQRQIVDEIAAHQRIIDGARQVVEEWEPDIEIDEEWDKVKLGDICENLDSQRKPVTKSDRVQGQYPYYGASGIVDYVEDYIFDGKYLLVSEDGANLLARSTPIAFSIEGKVWVNNHAHILKFEEPATQSFVEIYLNSIDLSNFVTGAAQPKLSQGNMNKIEIPLPPLEVQREIVARIERERSIVEGNRELIRIYEEKVKKVIERVWEG